MKELISLQALTLLIPSSLLLIPVFPSVLAGKFLGFAWPCAAKSRFLGEFGRLRLVVWLG